MTIGSDDPVVTFDWDAIDAEDILTRKGRNTINAKLLHNQSLQGCVLAYWQDKTFQLYGNPHTVIPWTNTHVRDRRGNVTRSQPIDVLKLMSAREQTGLFSIISQISPTGGDNLEDLAVLDPTDPDQWLLVVVVIHEDDFAVYRRLCRVREAR